MILAGRIDFFELARVGRARREYRDAHALGDIAGHGSGWGANANRCADCSMLSGLELRQYTLKPGERDVLIELFDRHFVESQESAGMTVIGQFRDRQRPERFVWMRGFPDMEGRHRALDRFYNGPVWAAHKTAANNTMVDSDNVLLLRPARPDTAFDAGDLRPGDTPAGVLVAIDSDRAC